MRTLRYLAPAFVALALASAAVPAFADVQGADTFRVAGLGRYQTLKLMNGPAEWSGVEVELPSNACNLRATGVSAGIWLQVSFRASNGYDYTGWVDARFLQAEHIAPPTDTYNNYVAAPSYDAYAPPQDYAAPVYEARPPRRDEARWWWLHRGEHRYGY